jgi:hypothetical protein
MVFGQIAVLLLIRGNGDTHGSCHQPIGFVGALAVVNAKNNFTRPQDFGAFFFGYPFAKRRVDA